MLAPTKAFIRGINDARSIGLLDSIEHLKNPYEPFSVEYFDWVDGYQHELFFWYDSYDELNGDIERDGFE